MTKAGVQVQRIVRLYRASLITATYTHSGQSKAQLHGNLAGGFRPDGGGREILLRPADKYGLAGIVRLAYQQKRRRSGVSHEHYESSDLACYDIDTLQLAIALSPVTVTLSEMTVNVGLSRLNSSAVRDSSSVRHLFLRSDSVVSAAPTTE